MAVINFTAGETVSDMLYKVATATGNDILDVGYLCRGERPFFRFGSSYYTKLHPSNAKKATSVSVYTSSAATDPETGETYTKMTYVGSGSQNGTTLTYGGTDYLYYVHPLDVWNPDFINKWSFRKPIDYDSSGILTDEQFRESDRYNGYFYGMKVRLATTQPISEMHDLSYRYLRPTSWKRLRDFNGYNHDATCELRGAAGSMVIGGLWMVEITHQRTSDGSVSFDDLVNSIMGGSSEVRMCYPCILVSKTDGSASYAAVLADRQTGVYGTLSSDLTSAEVSKIRDANLQQFIELFGGASASSVEVDATVFLTYALTGLSADGSYTDVTNTSFSITNLWLPIPFAIGKRLTVDREAVPNPAKVVSAYPGQYQQGSLPINFQIVISCPDGFTEDFTYAVELRNSSGGLLYSTSFEAVAGETSKPINISYLSAGIVASSTTVMTCQCSATNVTTTKFETTTVTLQGVNYDGTVKP